MTNVLENESAARLHKLDEESQAALFTGAHTAHRFDSTPVGDDQLRSIYELAKWAPTSANFGPLRVLFVQTPDAREKLGAAMGDMRRPRVFARQVHGSAVHVVADRPDPSAEAPEAAAAGQK